MEKVTFVWYNNSIKCLVGVILIRRVFQNLLVAQIISSATVTICMLVDNIMIGQFLGVDAIAAYGLASPVLFIFAAIGALISTGIQVICSGTMTTGDKTATNSCYSTSVSMALIISVLGICLVYMFTDGVVDFLGATRGTEVFDMTKQYLCGFMIGAPAFILATILVPYMQMANKGPLLVGAVVTMTVSDILFDYLNVALIKGGIFGMGIASALSYYVALSIALIYLLSGKCVYKFDWKLVSLSMFKKIIQNCIPTAINQLCYSGQVFTVNLILLSAYSSDAVAVFSVLSTVGSFVFSIGTGIGAVALTVGGMLYVEEDKQSINKLVSIIVKYSLALNTIVIVIVLVFAPYVSHLFLEEDARIAGYGTTALRMFILCLIPSSLNSSFKNFYQGIGKVWMTYIIAVLQNYAYICMFVLIFSKFNKDCVWLSFVLGEGLTFITMLIIVWVKKKRISFKASDITMLSSDFGVEDEDILIRPIQTAKELQSAVVDASEFCYMRSLSKEKSIKVALCVEEMGKNVLQHGFLKKNDNNMVIRLFEKGDDWVISIKDDCNLFDPVEYRRLHLPKIRGKINKSDKKAIKAKFKKADRVNMDKDEIKAEKKNIKIEIKNLKIEKKNQKIEQKIDKKNLKIENKLKKKKRKKVIDEITPMGINLVFGMAKDVKYVNSMGLNNLTIFI